MQTVFIDRKDSSLRIEHNQLKIKNDGGSEEQTLPLFHIHSVVISCDCQLSSGFLRNLAKYDISLVCINQRNINASFYSVPSGHGNIHRRLTQYKVHTKSDSRLALAKLIVVSKSRYQLNALIAFSKMRPELRTLLLRQCKLMAENIKKAKNCADVAELVGVEGSISKSYFAGFTNVFAAPLNFTKRIKRPATDPVNSALSLTYSIIYYEAIRACYASGLDPQIGLLHEACYGRASLACDMTEFIRAAADKWVYTLFATQTLREHHFSNSQQGGVILTKSGRALYYPLLMEEMLIWRRRLRHNSQQLAKHLDSFGNDL